VADLSGLLPLLHGWNQLRDSLEIVNLQQIDARRLQPLERAREALGARRARAVARGAAHQLRGQEHPIADAQTLERRADQRFAVAVAGRGVDEGAAELAHASELGADLLAYLLAEGVSAEAKSRDPLPA